MSQVWRRTTGISCCARMTQGRRTVRRMDAAGAQQERKRAYARAFRVANGRKGRRADSGARNRKDHCRVDLSIDGQRLDHTCVRVSFQGLIEGPGSVGLLGKARVPTHLLLSGEINEGVHGCWLTTRRSALVVESRDGAASVSERPVHGGGAADRQAPLMVILAHVPCNDRTPDLRCQKPHRPSGRGRAAPTRWG